MSYDIALYDRSFLRTAIDEDLGDYTSAPKLPAETLGSIKERLLNLGYTVETESKLCTEFVHPNQGWGLQVTVFSSEIAFSIPYWDDAGAAIAVAKVHARKLATEYGLGLTVQQDGETIA